ncbi:methyl-accepting chemotaxis protein, partial [Pseudomonas brassicacearum]
MNLKFRHKILLSACAVVVLAFALFTLYNDYLQRNTIGQNIEASVQQAGALTASSVQNWMSGRILVLENLAQDIALQGTDANVAGLVDQPSYTRNFLFTYLGQADGVFTQRPFVELPDGFDPRQRPWYGAAASAGHTVLTPPYQGTVGGLMMSIVTPVRSKASGELLGVAGGDLSLDTLVDIINAVDFGGIGHAFLADRDGQVIVSPDKAQVMKNLKDIYPGSTLRVEPGMQDVTLDGQARIISFAPVAGLPSAQWYIGLSIDKDKAYAALGQFRTSAIIAMLIAVAAIAGLLGLLIPVLMRPLTTMGRAMRDIAEGEGDLTRRLAVQQQDEFGELASSFNRFVERIHASITEVSSATRLVHDLSEKVVSASNASIIGSEEQSLRTNSVAAAINQLGAATQEIARNAADASQHASGASEQANDGRQVVDAAIDAMTALSLKISESCGQIEALNASTDEIASGASEQANDGRQVVDAAIDAMTALSLKISESCGQIEALNASTDEIGKILTNSVAAAINQLGAATQEIARNAADASQHASGASEQANDGRQVVDAAIDAM